MLLVLYALCNITKFRFISLLARKQDSIQSTQEPFFEIVDLHCKIKYIVAASAKKILLLYCKKDVDFFLEIKELPKVH